MKLKLFIVLFSLLQCSAVLAQKFSNRGRDFWTGYGLHYFMEVGETNSQQMVLYLSAEEAANVTVTIKGAATTTTLNYSVPANTVMTTAPMPKSGAADCRLFDVPPSFGGLGSDRLFDRSIHITSDVPIVAYAHISGSGSSGATMLMPVESWGYFYKSINAQQRLRAAPVGEGCYSWLFVVADHDNTVVEITPSVKLRNGALPGVPFTATLNRGQIYQVVGAAITNMTGEDLTGTAVKSIANGAGACYPVAVFAGSSSTAMTCNNTNAGFADNLIQQIFPIQAWGKQYITAPFSASTNAALANPSIYRVAISDPTTVVKKNGVTMTGIINGYYYEYVSSTADLIEADKPILVAQYIPSMSDGLTNTGCGYTGSGDPEMVYLSPVEQSINRIGFYRNTDANIDVNYLTLVIPDAGVTSLRIDGSNVFNHTYAHPNKAGYTVVVKRWPAAKAQCIVSSDSTFTAVTYGLGLYDSYAYNGGTYINNLNGTLSLHNTEGAAGAQHPFTCKNTPVELSVLMSYQPTKLVWNLSELLYMTPNADVTDNAPVPVGTVVVNGITYYKYTVPGVFQFSQAGTFRFTVNSTHPSINTCNNTEALLLDVVVKDISDASLFNYTQRGCVPDEVHFKFDPANAGTYTFNKWLWTFPNGTTGTKDTAIHTFTAAGMYDVKLKVVSTEGCVDDTTIRLTVDRLQFTYGALPDICENAASISVASAQVLNGITGTGNYKGPGVTSAGQFTPALAGAGTHTIWYVFTSVGGCIDSVSSSINVLAAPQAAFNITESVCIGNEVTITDATTATGSPLTTWEWDFGDGSSATYNNNASFKKLYNKEGKYTVSLVVTDARNCASNKVMKATTIHPIPDAIFKMPAVVCMPKGEAPFETVGVGLGGMSYEWNFGDGSPVSTEAKPVHKYTAAGSYNVSLQVTSAAGCPNSSTRTLSNFAQQPVAAYTVAPAQICQGSDVSFTDGSTPAGNITSWNWDFGDGTAATQQNPVKRFANAGTYRTLLTVTNVAGCPSDTVAKDVVVFIQPVVDAGPNFTVAEGTVVTFDPKVNSNNLVFAWTPAGALSGANQLRPSYIATRDQVFTLTATDGTSNCSASDQMEVRIIRPVKIPNAFSPNGDGINDTWIITNLIDYQGNTVEVFNRYGQRVFYSVGYTVPWDGRYNGNPVPTGVYYYVIDLKNGFGKLTGSITIIR